MLMIAVRPYYQGTFRREFDLVTGDGSENRHRIPIRIPEGLDDSSLGRGELIGSGVAGSDAREAAERGHQLGEERGPQRRVGLYRLVEPPRPPMYFSVTFESDESSGGQNGPRGSNSAQAELEVLDRTAAHALWERLPYRRGNGP